MLFLEGPNSAITALAFAPDGERLAVGNADGAIFLATFDLQPLATLLQDRIESLVFDPAGSALFASSKSGWFGFKPDAAGQWGQHAAKGTGSTLALAFLDDAVLAIGIGDRAKAEAGMFELRNLATGRRLEPRFQEPTGVRAVAAHGPSHTVAWVNANFRASLWNTLAIEAKPIPLAHHAWSLAFHPNGEDLAIVQDWDVKIYDVATRDERFALKGHTGRVTAVAYGPQGKTLATASWDQTVRLWDSASGANLATFDWGIGRVLALAFSPDGLRLAAGGNGGMVAICDME